MRFRGFDTTFWIAFAIVVPSLIGLFLLSNVLAGWTGHNRLVILLILAAGVWSVLHLYDLRMKNTADPEEEPIFCEWSARIDPVTFAADEELTRLSLESHGLDIRSAIGKKFVCMTEFDEDGKDYYFDGEFARTEDGRIVVLATNPEQLPASR